ncbi:MAG: nuclear transport factor 2 family protein [Bacteroidota bacterium]
MSPEKQQAIIEHYVDAYNRFDVEAMLRDLAPEILFQNVSNGKVDLELKGLSAFLQQAETAKAIFSERKQSITAWEFAEEIVRIKIDYMGVVALDLPNGLKAGDKLALQGQSEFTFADGKIIQLIDRA